MKNTHMHLFKKITLTLTLIMIMLASALVFAKITHTLLVVDNANQTALPGNFRTTADALPGNINNDGLAALHVAGSQQFTTQGLSAAIAKIPAKSIIIVDLRRESHGQLNGNAISWYGPQNAANAAKSPDQIRLSELRLLNRLKKSPFRWTYEITEKTNDDFIETTRRDFVRVESVKSEQQLAASHHLGYKRFYVEDFHAPDAGEVVRFVNFAKKLPDDTWLYFHCRAGKGRTTTFMTMVDMMKNARHVSFEDIINRQAALGGSNLLDLPAETNFKFKYASHRLNFLKNFYEYAKTNTDDFSTTWIQWKNNKSVKSS